jgi:predicted nucleic acid-binding protein
MSDRAFFDTTTLIYTISGDDFRADLAEALLAAGGFISVQVLNEFVNVARRKLKMPWEEIAVTLESIQAVCEPASPITVETHLAARAIAARYGYRIYDSLMLASAAESGCNILYSEDMQDGQQIGSVTIRNPFRKH